MEYIAILMFVVVFALILVGYPVALTLAGLSILTGLIFVPDFLDLSHFVHAVSPIFPSLSERPVNDGSQGKDRFAFGPFMPGNPLGLTFSIV
ncbi:MAG TPA: hypothetical protein PLZ32_22580 [Saprospiraceae bacterium]|nr:hypothetical protein [Saprospiraceae bacterium]